MDRIRKALHMIIRYVSSSTQVLLAFIFSKEYLFIKISFKKMRVYCNCGTKSRRVSKNDFGFLTAL
jgi:hypothetical protein